MTGGFGIMGKPVALIHCNAGGGFGMGHVMRCAALGEEAKARGWRVLIAGNLDAAAADYAGSQAGLEVLAAPSAGNMSQWLHDTVHAVSPQLVHLDSYVLPDADTPRGAWALSNMQDGSFGARTADLLIDPNFGAQALGGAGAGRTLVGVRYCPVRQQVRRRRKVVADDVNRPLRVLIVLGGTDPFGLTPRVAQGLLECATAMSVTVVAPEPLLDAIRGQAAGDKDLRLLPFTQDLPGLAHDHDLVVSAAGTSIWDFMCMGLPIGLMCVTENQVHAYRCVIEAGLAIPLGEPPHADFADRIHELDRILQTPTHLVRLARQGQELVDGKGAERIVQAWESMIR